MQTRATIDSLLAERVGLLGAARLVLRFAPDHRRQSAPVSSHPALYAQITRFTLSCLTAPVYLLAERVGFEPTNTVRCYTLSRRAPSTARPPLHAAARVPERTQPIKSSSRR